MLKALLVVVRFHWGFSIKRPLHSAAQFSLSVPPPTTLVGALSYACGAQRDSPEEAARLLNHIKWATFGFLERSPLLLESLKVGDMNRNLIAPFMRSQHRTPDRYFGVQAMEKIYVPGFKALVVYFGEVERYRDCAWGIVRIGSKESLVDVLEVEFHDVKPVGQGRFETELYVNAGWARPIAGGFAEEYTWPLTPNAFIPGQRLSESEFVKLYLPESLEPIAYESPYVIEFGERRYALPWQDGGNLK